MGFDRHLEMLSGPRFEKLFNGLGGSARTVKYEVYGEKAKIAARLGYDPRNLTKGQYDEVVKIYKRGGQ